LYKSRDNEDGKPKWQKMCQLIRLQHSPDKALVVASLVGASEEVEEFTAKK